MKPGGGEHWKYKRGDISAAGWLFARWHLALREEIKRPAPRCPAGDCCPRRTDKHRLGEPPSQHHPSKVGLGSQQLTLWHDGLAMPLAHLPVPWLWAQHPLPMSVGCWGLHSHRWELHHSASSFLLFWGGKRGARFKSVTRCNSRSRAAGGSSAEGCQPSGSFTALEISPEKKNCHSPLPEGSCKSQR